ncbi:hypothetical protein [Nocardia sp. NBC_00511]|uniref:hypothetical protein n=1 Tax=Nocardia sp. NBC_00511 TaxID=2903591 RepID=UPI0030E57360
MTRPIAVGYLRRDISGVRQQWDEYRLRGLAARFGYNLTKIIVFGRNGLQPKLLEAIATAEAEAVFVPSATHFDDGEVPTRLVQIIDVITVDTEETHARWSNGAVDPIERM